MYIRKGFGGSGVNDQCILFKNQVKTIAAKGMEKMRAGQKKQAEDFIGLMETAHSEIRKALEKQDIVTAQTLLGDCQNGAEALGNMIEEVEGEGCAAVQLLEEYCDLVYQIYEQISSGQTVSINKVYKKLRKALNRTATLM